jgi:hypothetical protein
MTLLFRLVDAFKKNDIKYALVGGYAVALHGVLRGTVDIDLLTHLRAAELEKMEKALRSLGLQSRIPVTAKEVAAFRKEYVERRNLIAWSFVNPKNPAEVVDILLTHDLSEVETTIKAVQSRRIFICQIDDLIRLKKEAGREQDLIDIKALQEIKKGRR